MSNNNKCPYCEQWLNWLPDTIEFEFSCTSCDERFDSRGRLENSTSFSPQKLAHRQQLITYRLWRLANLPISTVS